MTVRLKGVKHTHTSVKKRQVPPNNNGVQVPVVVRHVAVVSVLVVVVPPRLLLLLRRRRSSSRCDSQGGCFNNPYLKSRQLRSQCQQQQQQRPLSFSPVPLKGLRSVPPPAQSHRLFLIFLKLVELLLAQHLQDELRGQRVPRSSLVRASRPEQRSHSPLPELRRSGPFFVQQRTRLHDRDGRLRRVVDRSELLFPAPDVDSADGRKLRCPLSRQVRRPRSSDRIRVPFGKDVSQGTCRSGLFDCVLSLECGIFARRLAQGRGRAGCYGDRHEGAYQDH